MKLLVLKGTTNYTLDLFVQDSSATTGAGLTGLVFNSASLVCYYRRGATGTATALTLATQTVGGAHTDGGFVEIDATNMPGMYRLDLEDDIIATGVPYATIMLKGATNMAPVTIELQLTDVNVEDAVRMGMTALPNAAAEAAGGLYTRGTGAGQINQDANGRVDVNIEAISADATAPANLEADYDGTGYAKANSTVGTVTTLTGHTAQTGDSFARIGATGSGLTSLAQASVATEARLAELDAANMPTDLSNIEADTQNIQSRLPAALIGNRMDSDVEAINNNTASAVNLAASAETIVTATVDTAGFAPTTTEFESSLTEATADHFNGRVVIFRTGASALDYQAAEITDYSLVGGRGHFTVSALTEAPSNSDPFVIL